MAHHRRRRAGRDIGTPTGETGGLALTDRPSSSRPRWLIAGVPTTGSTGGAARARHVFTALAARTSGHIVSAHGRRGVPALALAVARESAGWRHPLRLASTQLLPGPARALLRGRVVADLLDLHDHPVLQAAGLGIALSAADRQRLERRFARNVATFERLVVPSGSFAELCGLPGDRVVVVTNGTDTEMVEPVPPPDEPIVGMVSGAAPGRGIELLLGAMARVRDEIPEANLRLALTATGRASAAYLRSLVTRLRRREPWATVREVPYPQLGAFLGEAAVLAIPHPPDRYLDVSTPVKLFDSMAAARPLAVTPRLETRRIVESCRAGLVAGSDSADALADVLLALLRSPSLRAELGANARRCAVERYDWRILSAGLADAVIGPDG